jgi:hypothetical protein
MKHDNSVHDTLVTIPTRVGKDLENQNGTKDAHIRIEGYNGIGTNIFVDVFDSAIRNSNQAHIDSQMLPWTDSGADQATRYLQSYGFRVAVMIK